MHVVSKQTTCHLKHDGFVFLGNFGLAPAKMELKWAPKQSIDVQNIGRKNRCAGYFNDLNASREEAAAARTRLSRPRNWPNSMWDMQFKLSGWMLVTFLCLDIAASAAFTVCAF